MSSSSVNDRNATEDLNDNAIEDNPAKRKRGRPKLTQPAEPEEAENTIEESSEEAPVVKRKRGRPKGSKNKNPKPKPVITGPPRPRGRPRKWPKPDENTPKRGRGRPRKNESQGAGLPTMVAPTGVATPITHDPIPPDEMFAEDLDS